MIDNSLIDENTTHCIQQINKRKTTDIDNLFVVDDFFTSSLIDKLLNYANNTTKWHSVELQENYNRTSVGWDPDTVIEEVWIIFNNLTNVLNELFGQNLTFNGIQLWRDRPGYKIESHVDNNRIGYSVQIYITGGIENLGTHFFGTNTVEIPYQSNSGYITSTAQQIPHGMIHGVSDNHTRYSVYAIWS